MVDSPTLHILKFNPDRVLGHSRSCFCQGKLDEMITEVSLNMVFYDCINSCRKRSNAISKSVIKLENTTLVLK